MYQDDLDSWLDNNPLLKEQYTKANYTIRYCNPQSKLCLILFFYPALCEYDVCQANAVKNIPTIYSYRIKSDIHGDTILPKNYRFLFWKHTKKLLKLHMHFKEKNITSEKLLAASSISYTIFYLFFSIYQRIKNSLKKYVISNM